MRVAVRYVAGWSVDVDPADWPHVPSAGVDWIELVCASGRTRLANHSLYWLYPEGETWVAGCGSVRYDPNPLTEVLCDPAGAQTERQIPYFPDLPIEAVKLGHWWPGTDRPLTERP